MRKKLRGSTSFAQSYTASIGQVYKSAPSWLWVHLPVTIVFSRQLQGDQTFQPELHSETLPQIFKKLKNKFKNLLQR
jgi:hypothetical protein